MKACAIGVSSLGASPTSAPVCCICSVTAEIGRSATALATPTKNSRRPGIFLEAIWVSTLENAVRHLGIEVNDALTIAEQIDV
jgi:hypothetical protein